MTKKEKKKFLETHNLLKLKLDQLTINFDSLFTKWAACVELRDKDFLLVYGKIAECSKLNYDILFGGIKE